MKRKRTPGCNCNCGCTVSVPFVINGCNALALGGPTVTLTDGSNSYSGTSVAGAVSVPVAGPATYTWAVSQTGFTTQTGSVSVTCGSTPSAISVTLAVAPGYHCCGGFAQSLPDTLYYSDANVTLLPVPVTGATWSACYSGAATDFLFSGGKCSHIETTPPGYVSGTVPIAIRLVCQSGRFTPTIMYPVGFYGSAAGYMGDGACNVASGISVVSPCGTSASGSGGGALLPFNFTGTWPTNVPGATKAGGGALPAAVSGAFTFHA